MADGIRQAKRPQPGGFDLSTFAPSLDAEAGESLGAFLEEFKSIEQSDLRARLAHAEEALNAIESLCALNPRLADGEIHHTAMRALAAVREGRR